MQTFSLATAIYSGEGALAQLPRLCGASTLIVTDEFFAKNGWANRLAQSCGKAEIFDRVQPDPPVELIAQGVAVMKACAPDTLVALGGGSAIDCAKAMLCLGQSAARLIAVPTSSGTGSEVTSFAIVTHDGVKHPLVDPKIRPAAAILDPALLEKLPPSLIADGGMDAAAHCLEAIAAKNASPFTDALAMTAFRSLLELLPKSFEGKISVRQAIHESATMAGIAFDNGGLGACHALSHALGGAFHTPHGRLNGVLLPHVIRFNAQTHPRPYEALAAYCGLPGIRGLLLSLGRLRSALKLPATLEEAGLTKSALLEAAESLAQAAELDPCTQFNPRPVTREDYAALLRSAL